MRACDDTPKQLGRRKTRELRHDLTGGPSSPRPRERIGPSATSSFFASESLPTSSAANGDGPVDSQHYRTLQAAKWRVFQEVIIESAVEALADLAATEAAKDKCSAVMPLEVLALNVKGFPRCVSSNLDFVVGDWGGSSAEQWFYATNGTAISFREGTPVPYIELLESLMPRFFEKAKELGFANCSRVPNTWTITISWRPSGDLPGADAGDQPSATACASTAPAPLSPLPPELPPTSPGAQFLQVAERLGAEAASLPSPKAGGAPSENMEALLKTFRSQFPEKEQLEQFVSQITGAAKKAVSTWKATASSASPSSPGFPAPPVAPRLPAPLLSSDLAPPAALPLPAPAQNSNLASFNPRTHIPAAGSKAKQNRPSSSHDNTPIARTSPRPEGSKSLLRRRVTRHDTRPDRHVDALRHRPGKIPRVRSRSRSSASASARRPEGRRPRAPQHVSPKVPPRVRTPRKDDDLESVTDSQEEEQPTPVKTPPRPVRSQSRSRPRSARHGVPDPDEAASRAKAEEAKDNLVSQLNEWKGLMMQIKDCQKVTSLHKDLEAKDTQILATVTAAIEAEQSTLASCIDLAWDGYAAAGGDASGEDARQALQRMRVGIADAQLALNKALDILRTETQPLFQIQTPSVRKKASLLLEEKMASLKESQAELLQWAPLLKQAPLGALDQLPKANIRITSKGNAASLLDLGPDPLAAALLRRGVIAAHKSAVLPQAKGSENLVEMPLDPELAAAIHQVNAKKSSGIRALCKGHNMIAVIKRTKPRSHVAARRFLACPISEKFGGCGFIRWIDKRAAGPARQDSDGSDGNR